MKVLTSLQQRLGFTHNEVKVVLFLSAMFLLGLGIRWYNAATQQDRTVLFDYASADSEFVTRSNALASVTPPAPAAPASSTRRKPVLAPKSVNLNTASAEQLILLPGIGPSYAARIITYRTEHGPFASIDALGEVKGIGKKRLEQIRPFVTVEARREAGGGTSKAGTKEE
jgi:competence protein ComEA